MIDRLIDKLPNIPLKERLIVDNLTTYQAEDIWKIVMPISISEAGWDSVKKKKIAIEQLPVLVRRKYKIKHVISNNTKRGRHVT